MTAEHMASCQNKAHIGYSKTTRHTEKTKTQPIRPKSLQ